MPKKRSRAGFSWKQEYGGVPAWGIAAGLGLLAVILAVPAVVNAMTPTAAPYVRPSDAFAEPAPTAEQPTAVWLGDSFTEGGFAPAPERFITLVSDHFGWVPVNAGQGGTGFITDGPAEFPERAPMPERIPAVVASSPEVVVVAAGINDTGRDYTSEQVREAVRATLTPLQSQLPEALIVVVGPFWPNGYPTDSALSVRDDVAAVASELGVIFVDPIGEGWITGTNDGSEPGNRVEYIAEDGTHPSPAGHAHIAERLISALAAAGVQPATT